jgi:hypothetical protein
MPPIDFSTMDRAIWLESVAGLRGLRFGALGCFGMGASMAPETKGATMKKPVNRVALFIWAVALFVAVTQLIAEPSIHYYTYQAAPELREPIARYTVMAWYFGEIRAGLISAALLIGSGTLVELIDQIRWNALHRDK